MDGQNGQSSESVGEGVRKRIVLSTVELFLDEASDDQHSQETGDTGNMNINK